MIMLLAFIGNFIICLQIFPVQINEEFINRYVIKYNKPESLKLLRFILSTCY